MYFSILCEERETKVLCMPENWNALICPDTIGVDDADEDEDGDEAGGDGDGDNANGYPIPPCQQRVILVLQLWKIMSSKRPQL